MKPQEGIDVVEIRILTSPMRQYIYLDKTICQKVQTLPQPLYFNAKQGGAYFNYDDNLLNKVEKEITALSLMSKCTRITSKNFENDAWRNTNNIIDNR